MPASSSHPVPSTSSTSSSADHHPPPKLPSSVSSKADHPPSSSSSSGPIIRRRRPRLSSSSSFLPFTLLFFLFLCLRDRATAVRCYCTDEHCVPYGVCEAAVCLVGLLRANSAVIRTCGNQPLGCQRNVDRWAHICSCDGHFCNTFLFLKASTNIDGGGGGNRGELMRQRHRGDEEDRESGDGEMSGGDGEQRVFQRMDPAPGEFATFDHPGDDEERTIKNSNLLTLLLVIVPLSVGAAAVVVVAINYYCHLC